MKNLILILAFLFSVNLFAEEVTITGTITDLEGNPLEDIGIKYELFDIHPLVDIFLPYGDENDTRLIEVESSNRKRLFLFYSLERETINSYDTFYELRIISDTCLTFKIDTSKYTVEPRYENKGKITGRIKLNNYNFKPSQLSVNVYQKLFPFTKPKIIDDNSYTIYDIPFGRENIRWGFSYDSLSYVEKADSIAFILANYSANTEQKVVRILPKSPTAIVDIEVDVTRKVVREIILPKDSIEIIENENLSIYGRVFDDKGTLLKKARVKIEGTDFETKTNSESGIYAFEKLPPGKYWLIVRAIGSPTGFKEVTIEKGNTTELNFVLNTGVTSL